MRALIKKFLSVLIIFSFVLLPVSAEDKMKLYGNINDGFTLDYQDLPEEISFVLTEAKKVREDLIIPEESVVTLEVINARRNLRWHVSGLILCKLKNYIPLATKTPVDLSEQDIYMVVRKYEPIKGKDAAILTTEIILTQAAGIVGSCFIFFAPVDVAYFFTKGAIQRKKHPHWFRAGVMDAYDNSIFWFQLKGKPIELNDGDAVSVKEMSMKRAMKFDNKIQQRKMKEDEKHNNKIAKITRKSEKKRLKYEKKEIKCSVLEQAIENELNDDI